MAVSRTTLTVVRGATVADLAAAYTLDGDTTTAEQAVAAGLRERLWLVEHGGDLVLVGRGSDPRLPHTLHETTGCEVVQALFMGGVDYFTWTVVHDEGHRSWACGEGEVVVDDGTPLPEEAGTRLLDAATLARLLTARTGIEPTDLRGATAQGLSPGTGPARKRRWFGRLR